MNACALMLRMLLTPLITRSIISPLHTKSSVHCHSPYFDANSFPTLINPEIWPLFSQPLLAIDRFVAPSSSKLYLKLCNTESPVKATNGLSPNVDFAHNDVSRVSINPVNSRFTFMLVLSYEDVFKIFWKV